VKVLLELGAVGLLLFLAMLGICWKMTWRLFRNSKDSFLSGLGCATFVMLCTAAIVNFFGDRWSYLQVNGFLWVLLGLVARSMLLMQHDMAAGESQPESFPEAQPQLRGFRMRDNLAIPMDRQSKRKDPPSRDSYPKPRTTAF
jgi:hypothetical protein